MLCVKALWASARLVSGCYSTAAVVNDAGPSTKYKGSSVDKKEKRRFYVTPPRPKERLYLKPPPPAKEIPAFDKLDRKGHLRSPRAARELALSVLYAALVSGDHPLQVFDERLHQRLAVRGSFDKSLLETFSHSPADFANNEPARDEEAFAALQGEQEEESNREAEVLSAPVQIVYNKFVLGLAKQLIEAAANSWRQRESILSELIPVMWKTEYKSVALPICILHLALAELEVFQTSPSVVVNEAVELTKRYCDGVSPRVVNGCLGSYIRRRNLERAQVETDPVDNRLKLVSERMKPEELGWNDDYRE